MKPQSIRQRWLSAAAATVAVAAVAAVSAGAFAAPAGARSAHSAASSTLTMESSQITTLVDNFNPFVEGNTTVGSIGVPSLIYESLLQFDIAKPTQAPYDFLATKFKWGAGGTSITFTIRTKVKFSNGQPLTPQDVAGTYNLVAANKDINSNGLSLASPAATVKGDTVTLHFTTASYTALQYIGTVPIVLPSQWSGVGDPGKYTDTSPVGTGPYTLSSFSATAGIVLKANPKYWGGPFNHGKAGPPAISTIEFPTYASTSAVLSALDSNTLDWAGNFITGLSSFTSGAGHAVWFAGVNTNSLVPNLAPSANSSMANLAVRQAVSAAIDRNDISSTGESGLEPPATNASGIVLPNFASQEASAVAGDTLRVGAQTAQADSILSAAGCTIDSAGYYSCGGKEVDIRITDPSDYTDYASDDTIMAADLQKAHINAWFDGLADAAWYSDLSANTFGDATSHWSNSAITLWGLYDGWLDSTLAGTGGGDFEDLNDPTVDTELTTLASASTPAAIKADAAPLEEYVASQLPIIPTVYGASFDEYNSGAFTGWPTASNQYESGSPNYPTNEVIVLHLKPKS